MSKKFKKGEAKPSQIDRKLIDRIRDSAGSFEVNPLDDPSPIAGFLQFDQQLYVIKEAGLYHIRLADEIDPQRMNIDIPNTIQRVLKLGANSEVVGRTLFTGDALFKTGFIPNEVDRDKAMVHLLAITRDLVAMKIAATEFSAKEKKILEASNVSRRKDRSVILPDVGEVESECKNFLQQGGHVQRELLEIVKLFYRGQKFNKWFDSLRKLISESQKKDEEFLKFLDAALPLLRFVRAARNCVEHPNDREFVRVVDFSINSNGELLMPTIEVIHPTSPHGITSASIFMNYITDEIVNVVELMIVILCGRHVQPFAGMDIVVYRLPKERIQDQHVRYSYGTVIGGKLTPIG